MAIKRIVVVSSYPPRLCGIATFTQDLVQAMQCLLPEVELGVCALNEPDHEERHYPPEVILQIDQEDRSSYALAAETINQQADTTMVIVQHEYGIYGGADGAYLGDFMSLLNCSVISTLHTVTDHPAEHIRAVTEKILKHSDSIVTLTNRSKRLLSHLYPDAATKTICILHGIHPLLYKEVHTAKQQLQLENHRVLVTFGLLSRNKGLEYVIQALPAIKQHIPNILYVIVGGTHPGVIRQEGESYRHELSQLILDLDLSENVRFAPGYQSLESILDYLQAADIYIASSIDVQQTVSGTLSYALGAGRAVISTDFQQALEIVTPEVGRIVEIGSPKAISDATIELLSDPAGLEIMHHAAYRSTRSMLWSNVADDYLAKVSALARQRQTVLQREPVVVWDHLLALSSGFGLLQFTKLHQPDRMSGYTLDDNSRALQVINHARQLGQISSANHQQLTKKYLRVLDACLAVVPAVNYLSGKTLRPTAQNLQENLSDSMARAYYALQSIRFEGSLSEQKKVEGLVTKLHQNSAVTDVHAIAQVLLGAVVALRNGDKTTVDLVDSLSQKLVAAYRSNARPDWRWFEAKMTYANGQICSSLLEAAHLTSNSEYHDVSLQALSFLCENCFMGDVYVPIGQDGWHDRSGFRALFDQQPEDVFAMMQALRSAYKLTLDEHYLALIRKAFSWFMGNNLVGSRIYDDATGGCHDGLEPNGVNLNIGAESTLSYLGSRLIIEQIDREQWPLGSPLT